MRLISCKNKKAFGLIETLIACAILIMIAAAALALNVLINNNLQFTRERAYAQYRAMEAIEAVRAIRETNYIDGKSQTNWNSFVCNHTNSRIEIPSVDFGVKYYPNMNCSVSGMSGRFFLFPVSPSSSEGTRRSSYGVDYSVYLTFESSGISPDLVNGSLNDNSIKAVATVEWNSRGRFRKIEISEILTNWRQSI